VGKDRMRYKYELALFLRATYEKADTVMVMRTRNRSHYQTLALFEIDVLQVGLASGRFRFDSEYRNKEWVELGGVFIRPEELVWLP